MNKSLKYNFIFDTSVPISLNFSKVSSKGCFQLLLIFHIYFLFKYLYSHLVLQISSLMLVGFHYFRSTSSHVSESNLGRCLISRMELFVEIINSFYHCTVFAKYSIINVR